MLYFRKYLTNSQKTFFAWKMMKVPIVYLTNSQKTFFGWNFQVLSCFGFVMATLQLFQHPENVKISILPFRLSHQKCYIFTSIWRIFKNFLFAARHGTWLLWLKIARAQVFWFCNGNVTTFPTSRKCTNFNSFPLDSPTRNAISSQVFDEFSKNVFCMKDDEGGYCEWKVQGLTYFSFAIATLQIFQHPENVKISILPFTLSRQKCYIFESI